MEGAAVSSATWMPVITAITDVISISAIVEVLAAVTAITVTFAFMWWGVRFAIAKVMKAIRKGQA